MATPVIMPRQGQSVESCIIGKWHKKPGDAVAVGDNLFTYETDKATFDETASVAGTLLTFIPATGDYINSVLLGSTRTVMIGQVIDAQFLRVLDYPTAAALSFILMVCILILVLIYIRRFGTKDLF